MLYVFSSSVLLSQAQSAISVGKKLSVIKTEYFDIIFTQESIDSAQFLALHADELYIKAKDFLKVEKILRIPVVLTQQTDVLNGYYTFMPYSRIVIYDTLPQTSLAVFDDTLLSVFYHELIHAVSFRIAISNFKILNNIHSFCSSLDMPTSITEGTAVLAESLEGYGRLNSSYSMHVVRQAKIENKFPDWSDITGSYSLYTAGSLPYIFGGAFMQYMYEEFGSQKLADFWNKSNNFDLISYTRNFKKVYGISIENAWADFEESVVIPSDIDYPTEFNTKRYLYQNLASSPLGIAWQDGYTGNVYFLPDDSMREDFLFTTDLTSRLSFSRDGKYLVISGTTGLQVAENSSRIFDMEKRRFIVTQSDIRDAMLIDVSTINLKRFNPSYSNDSYVLGGIQTNGQIASFVTYDIQDMNTVTEVDRIDFNFGAIALDPVDIGNGNVVVLLKNNEFWDFFVYNIITHEQRSFRIAQGFQLPSTIASLYAGETKLYFSYAQTSAVQPTVASIELSHFTENRLDVLVYDTQLSGGIYNPIEISSKSNIAYISRFYENNALSQLNVNEQNTNTVTFLPHNLKNDEREHTFEVSDYRAVDYLSTGIVIPFIGSVNLTTIDERVFSLFSLGITGVTIEPAERLLLIAGAGWDPFSQETSATLSAYFSEKNIKAFSENRISLSFEGIESFGSMLNADMSIPIISDNNRIGIVNNSRLFYFQDDNNYYYKGSTVDNTSSIYFQSIYQTGNGYYEQLGLILQYSIQLSKYFGESLLSTNETLFGHIVYTELIFPRLLPFDNPNRFTVNLPFSLNFAYFNRFTALWEGGVKVVLFSYDVQDALNFLHLFFRRITLDAQANYVDYKELQDTLVLTTSLFTTATLNFGMLTNSPVDIGVNFHWEPLKDADFFKADLKFELNF